MKLIDEKHKDRSVKRIILLEGAANLLVLALKLVVGLVTGSMAVLADALHSLTDVANNFVAWFVVRLSQQPADAEHPYGHRKFETLAVFGLASLLVVLAFELLINAIKRDDSVLVSEPWALGLMLLVLTINLTVSLWQRYWARRLDSDILLADASHTLSDVLVTSAVIIGWQLSMHGFPWLDRAAAIGVALLVLYLAYTLFKRAIPVLVDESSVDPAKVKAVVLAIDGVIDVTQIRSRWIGSDRAIDLVFSVAPSLSIEESHQIADDVEAVLEATFKIADVSVHIEPHS